MTLIKMLCGFQAYQNMQDFPEVLSSGKDAMRVKGIGQKIADMLDRKMQQSGVNSGAGGHVLGGGPPGQPAFSQGAPGSSQQQDSAPKAAPKKRKKAGDPPPEGANEADPAQPAKRKRAPKPYVPEYRSGAYALLVTLYLEKYGPARNDGMLKADLMRKAEEHCNSSFAEASDKNGWYTAWDAMTKLRDKGLVCKLGNPAVYALTEPDGDNLAKALVESGQRSGPEADGARSFPGAKRPEEPTVISGSAPPRGEAGSFIRSEDLGQYLAERRATSGKPPPAPKAPASQDRDLDSARRPPARPAPPSDGPICLDSDSDDGAPPSSNPVRRGSFSQPLGNATTSAIHAAFQFEYLEEEALVSSNKERAQVRLSGSDLQLRIRFHIRQSGHPFVMSHVVDRSLAPVDGYLTGWLRDEIAPARCPGIDVAALTAPPPVPPSPSGKGKGKAKEAAPAVPRAAPPPADYVSKQPLPSQAIPKPASSNLSKSGTASAPAALGTGPKVNEFRGQPIVLKRGTYDVVLVLDMRENKTRQYAAVQERDWMLERLYTKGIRAETKVMELGDFCWIAKPKSSNGPVDEIVLDFVVERKALDDLKMSIHEGRFEEQKFRMVNSGVNNVIYVIEGMIPRNDPSWAEHLKKTYSAMSLLQVGHGFFVKQTLNKDDTLNYLEQLTIWIQQLYLVCAVDFRLHAIRLSDDLFVPDGGHLRDPWRLTAKERLA